MKRIVHTEEAPKPIGPYSQAIRAGDFLFVSGQIAIDPKTGELVKGDITQMTQRILENIKAILASEGLGMDAIVKVTIFLRDMGKFSRVNDAYAAYFRSSPPARSTVEVTRLPGDVDIEIDAIALIQN